MEISQLLENIRTRETSGGIATAEFYVKALSPCIGGEGLCPTAIFGEAGASTWAKELEGAAERLTFSAPEMIVKKASCCGSCAEGKPCDGGGCSKKKPKTKGADGILAEFDCVMTTPVVDREGDIVVTKGLTFDPRMPLLWHHLLAQPVGVIDKILHHDAESAVGRFKIIATKMGEDVALLAEHGALRTSIGFQPKDIAPRETYKKGGETKVKNWLINKAHVHENSLVSVPANQEVVITAFSRKQLQDDLVNHWAKQFYDARPAMTQGTDFDIDELPDEDELVLDESELPTDKELADTFERQLAHDRVLLKPFAGHLSAGRQNAKRNRQVERRRLFGQLSGRQIDHHPIVRPQVAGVHNRTTDPMRALLHRRFRQPHQHRLRLRRRRDIDLHLDRFGFDSQ